MTSFQDLERKGTYAELGNLLGITRQAVYGLIGRGAIPKNATLLEQIRAYGRHMDGRIAAAASDDPGTLTAARIRESNAKAHKAEVEVSEKLRELVSARETEAAVEAWAGFGVTRINQAAAEIAANLQGIGIPVELDQIRAHLADARRALAPPTLAGVREDDQ